MNNLNEEAGLTLTSFNLKKEGEVWRLYTPNERIESKVYSTIKKMVQKGLGGKWIGGKTQAFEFEFDPSGYLEILKSGTVIDLKKMTQFYHTPPQILEYFFESNNLRPDGRMLEPGAGQGHLIEQSLEYWRYDSWNRDNPEALPETPYHYYEFDPFRREALKQKYPEPNFKCLGANYLDVYHPLYFDHIFINPPFSGTRYWSHNHVADIPMPVKKGYAIGLGVEHVRKAWEDLAPSGSIYGVLPTEVFRKTDKAHKAFQDFFKAPKEKLEIWYQRGMKYHIHWVFETATGYEHEFLIQPVNNGGFKEAGTSVSTLSFSITKGLANTEIDFVRAETLPMVYEKGYVSEDERFLQTKPIDQLSLF